MDLFNEKDAKKSHRTSKAGRKAEKKKQKVKQMDTNLTPRQRNPKAFAIQNVVRAERSFRRSMDIKVKKQHIPQVDHMPLQPPPFIVAIVGPPKVGKSTLMRCLIKNFTRQNMSEIKGPVTVVSGKKRRLTLIECGNDINVMIDVAKVADLILLLVDASFGFEMEIFEFLNICQIHGFPRIMGVLTHLDYFRNNKQLRKIKKTLKHRFWTEIYPGAKLFYLSGMIRSEYQRTEIHNLGRFISVMKIRPIQWRTTHPYLLADRMEDLTDPEKVRRNPKCDRMVCFYGYSRGANFRNRSSIHIPGCGDFVIKDISFIPDPCPLPDKEKKRCLNEKEKLIYAPFAGVGGIVYDKDAVYIDVGGSHSHTENKSETPGLLNELVASLIESRDTLDGKMASSQLQIFKNADAITSEEAEQNMLLPNYQTVVDPVTGRQRRKVVFEDEVEKNEGVEINDSGDEEESDDEGEGDDESDADDDEAEFISPKPQKRKFNEVEARVITSKKSKMASESELAEEIDSNSDAEMMNKFEFDDEREGVEDIMKWKDDLASKAAKAFYARQRSVPNLRRMIYGNQNESKLQLVPQQDSEELGGLFKVVRNANKAEDKAVMDCVDSSKFIISEMQNWDGQELLEKIKDCFVTGKWKSDEDATALLEKDDELYGDFEDLEKGEKIVGKTSEESDDDDEDGVEDGQKTTEESRLEKKKKLKESFNLEYDDKEGESTYYDDLKNELDQQTQLNKNEFVNMDDGLRVQLEGFRPGMYLRIEVSNVPCELVTNFDPDFPVILGGLQSGEENISYVNVRFKKHRWYKKTLKTRDPVIISLGWRRFQTIPLYSIQDHNGRCRLLKYTPEHLHCLSSFWGPVTPQGTGCLAVQSVSDVSSNFRIAATGIVIELDKSTQIVKKLKLTGIPHKIYKKTAFIRGMFTTALEVTKFEGAAIRTVSGIRGQIKKAERTPEGSFRATFEDKILMSDIVFLRAWYKVDVPQFYNLVTSMLLPPSEKAKWSGMRTMGQLRRDYNIPAPFNQDSIYKPTQRIERSFQPLIVPRGLQKNLPYRDKPKTVSDSTKVSLDQQRLAVIQEPHERKVSQIMKMVKTVYQAKQRQEREAMKSRVLKHRKELEEIERKRNQRQKRDRKQLFRALGKVEHRGKPASSS